MKYTKEIYIAIKTKRPSLSVNEIDARSEATIMCWVKEIDFDLYINTFRNIKFKII